MRRRVLLLLALLAVAGSIAACGHNDSADDNRTPAAKAAWIKGDRDSRAQRTSNH